VLDAEEVGALMSFRNLSGVSVMQSSEVGVADVIGHQSLVISQTALEQLTRRASEGKDG
jgi:large subunit ribosomal protein L4